jgi:DnaJ-class molecular chaperone
MSEPSPYRCPECSGTGKVTVMEREIWGAPETPREVECKDCEGTGDRMYWSKCEDCNGDGYDIGCSVCNGSGG